MQIKLLSIFATFILSIMHFVYPQILCISIVFDFSWDDCKDNVEVANELNGFALGLGLKRRLRATRNSAILLVLLFETLPFARIKKQTPHSP